MLPDSYYFKFIQIKKPFEKGFLLYKKRGSGRWIRCRMNRNNAVLQQ